MKRRDEVAGSPINRLWAITSSTNHATDNERTQTSSRYDGVRGSKYTR